MELVAKLRSTLQNRVAEAMEESSAQDVDTFVQNYRGRDDSSSD